MVAALSVTSVNRLGFVTAAMGRSPSALPDVRLTRLYAYCHSVGVFGWTVVGSLAGVVAAMSGLVFGLLQYRRRRRPPAVDGGAADRPATLTVTPPSLSSSEKTLEYLSRLGVPVNEGWASMLRAKPPTPSAGIPPEGTDYFIDRETELAALRSRLKCKHRVVLHGLGGVGKTQLAIHYVDKYSDAYRSGQFWLRAGQETTLVSDLASLAWRLELDEREQMQERQVEAVLRWLRKSNDWLMVLDNVEHEEIVRYWLGPRLGGDILETSRTPHGADRLPLDPLPAEIATRFLLERTGQEDAAGASAIAADLGGLPLALEQAAAYLVENDWRSLAEYAGFLRTRKAELLREGRPIDYPLSVAATWELSFRRISADFPAAADFLNICAFLAPDDIPITVFQDVIRSDRNLDPLLTMVPGRLREALADEIQCDRLVRTLRGYSLMARQGDSMEVHRLVQFAVLDRLTTDEQQRWSAAAMELVLLAMPLAPAENQQDMALAARLFPHLEVQVDRIMGDDALHT
jgi:hypothetical protein